MKMPKTLVNDQGEKIYPTPGVGDKVRLLTVKNRPIGTITRIYRLDYSSYIDFYWVRTSDGILMKDLSQSEIETEWERLASKLGDDAYEE